MVLILVIVLVFLFLVNWIVISGILNLNLDKVRENFKNRNFLWIGIRTVRGILLVNLTCMFREIVDFFIVLLVILGIGVVKIVIVRIVKKVLEGVLVSTLILHLHLVY